MAHCMTTEEPTQPDQPDQDLQDTMAALYKLWAKPDFSSTHLFSLKREEDDDQTFALDGEAFNAHISLMRTYIAARILAHWEATGQPAKGVKVLISVETFSRKEDVDST